MGIRPSSLRPDITAFLSFVSCDTTGRYRKREGTHTSDDDTQLNEAEGLKILNKSAAEHKSLFLFRCQRHWFHLMFMFEAVAPKGATSTQISTGFMSKFTLTHSPPGIFPHKTWILLCCQVFLLFCPAACVLQWWRSCCSVTVLLNSEDESFIILDPQSTGSLTG